VGSFRRREVASEPAITPWLAPPSHLRASPVPGALRRGGRWPGRVSAAPGPGGRGPTPPPPL